MFETFFGFNPEASKILLVIAIAMGGLVAGHLVEYVAIKFSERMGLKRHVRFGLEKQLERIGVNADVVGFFGKIMKYIVYLGSVFIILEALDMTFFAEFLRSALLFTPNVVAAIAVIIFGSVITEFASDLIKFSIKSNGVDALLEEAGVKFKISNTAAASMRYFLYSVILVIALAQLGLQVLELMVIISILWFAMVSTLAFFAIFGLKEMLPDIFAGMYLRSSKRLAEGDRISLGPVKGDIKKVGFVSTEIEVGKEAAYIPNGQLLKEHYTLFRVPRKAPGTS